MTEEKRIDHAIKETDQIPKHIGWNIEISVRFKEIPVSVLEEQSIQDMDGRLYEKAFK